MASYTRNQAATALSLLADAAVERDNELEQQLSQPIVEDTDEENGTDCLIFDHLYEQGEAKSIVEMTNFDPAEFDAVWEGFRNIIHSSYNTRHGRNSERAPKHVLFMILAMLKHGGQLDLMAKVFDMKPPTFERIVMKFIGIVSDAVYEHYVVHQAKK